MREQKAKYLFVGLKSSRHTKIVSLLSQKQKTNIAFWCGCSPSIRKINNLLFDDTPAPACGVVWLLAFMFVWKFLYSFSPHGHCFQSFCFVVECSSNVSKCLFLSIGEGSAFQTFQNNDMIEVGRVNILDTCYFIAKGGQQ